MSFKSRVRRAIDQLDSFGISIAEAYEAGEQEKLPKSSLDYFHKLATKIVKIREDLEDMERGVK